MQTNERTKLSQELTQPSPQNHSHTQYVHRPLGTMQLFEIVFIDNYIRTRVKTTIKTLQELHPHRIFPVLLTCTRSL